jgi:hypothetical protein
MKQRTGSPSRTGAEPEEGKITIAQFEGWFKHWKGKAEKAMRLFGQGRLSNRDMGHDTANLATSGWELGLDEHGITILGRSCLEMARDLVSKREATRRLNPRRSQIKRWDPHYNIRSAQSPSTPWELSGTAQLVPYNLEITGMDDEDCLDNCKKFMFTDYTFMGSWDASKSTTVRQW